VTEQRRYVIVLLPGDGIGPEVTSAAVQVLEAASAGAAGFILEFERHAAGAACYQETGEVMSAETLARCGQADAVLKGPVGLPEVRAPDGTEAGLLGGVLRRGFDLYANVRPIRLFSGVQSPLRGREPGSIDYVIVRENTEGLYISRGLGVVTEQAAADTLLVTRKGCERVVRYAFELAQNRIGAPEDGIRRVTCVDKSNVLRSLAFFREIFLEVGAEYPEIEKETIYVDAAAQAMVLNPNHFGVLVCENLIGDILSDLGGATVGGLGFCPSANVGDAQAYFEPLHGSAPSLAGHNRANPVATILSAALMLDRLGERAAADRINQAVERALREGAIRVRTDGTVVEGTREAGEAVAALLWS
jgi:3-isopropylmalate dehydrogenase